jgi:antitoxin VapB
MGVQLNIKDAETIRMARELAGSSGRTVTAVIRDALEHELQKREADIDETIRDVNEILKDSQHLWKEEWRGRSLKEIMDSIYDEDGLPT